jgi:hypothetical protein
LLIVPTVALSDEPVLEDELVQETVGGACEATGSETVATDRDAYQPNETVYMSGSGYVGDCDVVVRVTRPDGSVVVGDGSFAPGSDTVSIPTDGALAYQYILNGVTGTYLVEVIGAEEGILASTTFDDANEVRLHTDSGFLTQNRIFRRGDTVYARFQSGLTVGPPQYVKFVVLDPSGTSVQTSGCLLASSFASSIPTNSYLIGASDPLSGSSAWTYRMTRYGNDSTCVTPISGTSQFNSSFYVAQAFAFADSTARNLCTAESSCDDIKSVFGAGQTAWVKVLGVPPNSTDRFVQWVKPNSTTSPAFNLCRNTSGTDNPDSDATGGLATGYTPVAVGETPDASPASVASCGAFAAGEQGLWKVTLSGFSVETVSSSVQLSPFSVDLIVPTVTIIKPLPAQNKTVTPSDAGIDITWDADEAGTYSVRVGGTSCTTGTEVESGTYSTANADIVTTIDATDLAYGANTIRVCVADAAGNTGSATTTVYRQAPTSLLYNGGQIVNIGTNLSLAAKLTSSNAACSAASKKITFSISPDPDGAGGVDATDLVGSVNTNGSGQATSSINTTGWDEGVYEITATFPGTNECAGSTDTATLTIAAPGQAANGGGWYTLSGSGRVSFGFTVRKEQGTTNTYKGQLVLINNGKWRLKGTLDSFSRTTANPPNGAAGGTGDLYVWSSTLTDWVLSEAGVSFTASFKDDGQGGKKSRDKFGIHINHTLASGEPGLPNSSPQYLKGGNVKIV